MNVMRNFIQPQFRNESRLAVKKLIKNVIKRFYIEEDVLIPCILMIPIDLPSDFKRQQFPVRLAFAIRYHK